MFYYPLKTKPIEAKDLLNDTVEKWTKVPKEAKEIGNDSKDEFTVFKLIFLVFRNVLYFILVSTLIVLAKEYAFTLWTSESGLESLYTI